MINWVNDLILRLILFKSRSHLSVTAPWLYSLKSKSFQVPLESMKFLYGIMLGGNPLYRVVSICFTKVEHDLSSRNYDLLFASNLNLVFTGYRGTLVALIIFCLFTVPVTLSDTSILISRFAKFVSCSSLSQDISIGSITNSD